MPANSRLNLIQRLKG